VAQSARRVSSERTLIDRGLLSVDLWVRAPSRAERRLAALSVCAGLGLAACTSTEQLDSIESRLAEIQRQIQQVQRDVTTREDLAAIETRVSEEAAKLLRSGADTSADLDTVASRIGELEEQIRETLYRIDQLSQQVAATNEELKALPNRAPVQSAKVVGPPLPASDPETLYQDAYADYRAGSYDLAILGFQHYLETYPETELADNAMYWMGESYFGQGRFNQAIAGFDQVLSKYPRSEKVASAMLKRGYARLQLGERDRGIEDLRALIRTHPSSEEAAIARQQLETLEGQRSAP
jgi:tol-pal system protein YbgF